MTFTQRLRQMINAGGHDTLIQVDGGINDVLAKQVCDAGADVLVAGSYVYGADDCFAAIAALKK